MNKISNYVDVAGMRDRERNLWVSVLSVRVSLMTARWSGCCWHCCSRCCCCCWYCYYCYSIRLELANDITLTRIACKFRAAYEQMLLEHIYLFLDELRWYDRLTIHLASIDRLWWWQCRWLANLAELRAILDDFVDVTANPMTSVAKIVASSFAFLRSYHTMRMLNLVVPAMTIMDHQSESGRVWECLSRRDLLWAGITDASLKLILFELKL